MDTVFLTGAVGAGKTTIAEALGDLLAQRGVVNAVVDTDEIRRLRPPPAGDPFQLEVQLANLAAMAATFRAAGAQALIVAGVIEGRVDLDRARAAVAPGRSWVVRLTTRPDRLQQRLAARHADDETVRAWHAARAVELTGILDAAGIADLDLDTTDPTPREAARAIREFIRSSEAGPDGAA
jgi:adenylylsulfate kinase-like enzyme